MSERRRKPYEERGNGFAPLFSASSKALILGSYPSPKSFETGFYYGHPHNRFWPLVAALAGRQPPRTIEEKRALILESNLALWDSLQSCRIVGAADTSIQDAVPNDIPRLLQNAPIQAIFCNGAAAHRYYERFCEKATGLSAVRLPSTSPANAAFGFARLLEAWAPLRAYMPPTSFCTSTLPSD